jgi:preprotein translocase subunit YajC
MLSQIVFVFLVGVGLWFVFRPQKTKLDRLMDKHSNLMVKASIAAVCLATAFGIYLTAN